MEPIFDADYEREIERIRAPNKNHGLGLGRKVSKAYSRHKKALLLTTIVTGMGIGIMNMAYDGIINYRIGMQKAAENHIVRQAEQLAHDTQLLITGMESSYNRMSERNEELEAILSDLQSSGSQHIDELASLRHDYSAATHRIGELEGIVRSLQSENSILSASLSDSQAQIESMTESIVVYQSNISDSNTRIASLESTIRQVRESSNANDSLLSAYEREIAQKDSRISELSRHAANYNAIQSNNAELQNNIRQLENQISNYQSELSQRNATIASLESSVQTLTINNNDIAELRRSYDSQLHQKDSRIQSLEEQLQTANDNLAGYELLEQQLTQSQRELLQSHDTIIAYERQIETVQSELSQRNTQVVSLQATIYDLRNNNDISELQRSYDAQLQQKDIRIQNLEEQLIASDAKASGASSLAIQIDNLQQQVSQYEQDIMNNESIIANQNSTISFLTRELSSVRSSQHNSSANDNYDNSAMSLLSMLQGLGVHRDIILGLDNYDAIISYRHPNSSITLDIIDKGCRSGCTSHARILSTHNNPYSLEWGSFNHADGGYALAKDAFDRAIAMLR
jgi:chromosome segregation ATPase